MNLTLTSKHSFTDTACQHVWTHIEEHVTRDECEQAIEQAVTEIKTTLTASERNTSAYGWSGGKDSIALQEVCRRAGVHRAVAGIIPHLEYRSYLHWCERHKPPGIIVYTDPLDHAWLARNPRYLFPTTSRDGYKYTLHSARQAQHRYQEEHRPPVQIFGRRTQDGNVCGDERGILKTKRLTAYSPLRAWPHEMILAVIRYNQLALPPIYARPRGWTAGTGSWPGRRRLASIEASWDETWQIEADRVREAAIDQVPGAQATLERNGT